MNWVRNLTVCNLPWEPIQELTKSHYLLPAFLFLFFFFFFYGEIAAKNEEKLKKVLVAFMKNPRKTPCPHGNRKLCCGL